MVWIVQSTDQNEDPSSKMNEGKTSLLYIFSTIVALLFGAVLLSFSLVTLQETNEQPLFSAPDIFLCPNKPYRSIFDTLEAKDDSQTGRKEKISIHYQEQRVKRQQGSPNQVDDTQIRRVFRPLAAPPQHGWNFVQEPALYHDTGARCKWIDLPDRRLSGLDQLSYDFQLLELINCTNPADCRTICMRMHKPNDPNVCNYVIMNKAQKIALFYNIDPTVNWNLTQDAKSDSFFWKCNSIPCDWYWRRFQRIRGLPLDAGQNLILKTQCRDFAACQRLCETHPACNYVVMPTNKSIGGPSFLYALPDNAFQQTNFELDGIHHSFEMSCRNGSSVAPPSPSVAPPNNPAVQGQVLTNPPPALPEAPKASSIPLPGSSPARNQLEFGNIDPKSLPQQRSKRSIRDLSLKKCRVADVEIHCADLSDEILSSSSLSSSDHCLHVTLSKRILNKKFNNLKLEMLFDKSNAIKEKNQLQDGYWISLSRNQMQKDIFVNSNNDQENEYRIESQRQPASPEMTDRCNRGCLNRLAIGQCRCTVSDNGRFYGHLPRCSDEQVDQCLNFKVNNDQEISSKLADCIQACDSIGRIGDDQGHQEPAYKLKIKSTESPDGRSTTLNLNFNTMKDQTGYYSMSSSFLLISLLIVSMFLFAAYLILTMIQKCQF
uniref:Uncharacterized protein n=1 Tax=Romanomermis culicivorax TaxID=13658 RepID=A0A915K956_ROMCU